MIDRNLYAVDLVNLYPKIMRNVKLQAVIIFRNTHTNKVSSCCSSSHNSTGRRSICQQYQHLRLFCSIKQKKNCGIPHFPSISNARVSSILECNYTNFETAGIIFVPDQLQAWLERTYLLCVCVRGGVGGRLSAYLVWTVRVLGFADTLKDSPMRTLIEDVALLQHLGKQVVFLGLKTPKILHWNAVF